MRIELKTEPNRKNRIFRFGSVFDSVPDTPNCILGHCIGAKDLVDCIETGIPT